VESKRSCRVEFRNSIQLSMHPIESHTDLMFSSNEADVLNELKRRRIVIAGSGTCSRNVEPVRDAEAHELRLRNPHVDSDIARIEKCRTGFVDLGSIQRCAKVVDGPASKHIRVADN